MDGIIVVNKHKGCTSHDIVYQVKKMVKEKVGHTGTLDPMATGVLPLLIGKGTRCAKYFNNHDKKYKATLQLGKKTDTADSEGKVIEEKEVSDTIFEKEYLEKILQQFLGKQEQMPPMYSAVKVNGKKMYEYARKGETIEVQPRKIEIYEITLIQWNLEEKQIEFTVKCSKGTYIRSLCEDIAHKLDTVGYMASLERLQVGEFDIKNAITLEELKGTKESQNNIQDYILTIEELFQTVESITLDSRKLPLFLNGVKLEEKQPDGVYRIYNQNQFIGIATIQDNKLKRDIIL